ncbi:MAG: glycosyltransferase family 4 protein [Gemmataceae bacterium]
MRIASITAGAAGMFCGSCLHDNALAAALTRLGHDALLVPTYTPIRTDEPDVSTRRVFLGGINVYLDQSSDAFARAPRFVRWLLDRPALIKLATKLSPLPDYGTLGELTISMLRGEHGRQRREFDDLVGWLAADVKPQIVTLTNVLLSGLAPAIKERLGVPVVAHLQGDDVFLDALSADHRKQCVELIRANDAAIDGHVATCRDYADYMAEYLGVSRGKIDHVIPGIDLKGHGERKAMRFDPPFVIGYFARIAPEKGLHVLAEAYIRLRQMGGVPPTRLRTSGYLGPHHRGYLQGVRDTLAKAGLGGEFEYVDSPDHASKVRFLQSLDLFSVPATFREPKGLYVLEALANGVPVVQPAFGSFPELIDATSGGVLTKPGDTDDLAVALARLLADASERERLGRAGQDAVRTHFTSQSMARTTAEIYTRYTTDTTGRKTSA